MRMLQLLPVKDTTREGSLLGSQSQPAFHSKKPQLPDQNHSCPHSSRNLMASVDGTSHMRSALLLSISISSSPLASRHLQWPPPQGGERTGRSQTRPLLPQTSRPP